MKALYSLIAILFISTSLFAQTTKWGWSTGAGGNDIDEGTRIATDLSGNVISVGQFKSASINIKGATITNTNAGAYNIFVYKCDSTGKLLWAKGLGGSSSDYCFGVATDAWNNIYITGDFHSPSISFGSITLNNPGGSHTYIAKYDADGNVLWAEGATGSDHLGYSVATDKAGNVFLLGWFSTSTVKFGNTTTLNNAGSYDVYLTKYDSSGNALWAIQAGGNGYDAGYGVATDNSGNAYITGYFNGTSIIIGGNTLLNSGTQNIFLAKFDPSGTFAWAKVAGGTGTDIATTVAADTKGNVYLSGNFQSPSIDFGPGALINQGGQDIYLAKFDSMGTTKWAKRYGSTGDDFVNRMATDADGNVFLAGSFNSPTLLLGSTTLTTAGNDDIFIALLDGQGNNLWAIRAGGTDNDEAVGISLFKDEAIYMTGYFQSPTLSFVSTVLTNAGSHDIFNAKLLQCNLSAPIIVSDKKAPCEGEALYLSTKTAAKYAWSTSDTTQAITVYNAGQYSVTVTNGIGCTASSSDTVSFGANPVPTVNRSGFLLASSSGLGYQWYRNDSAIAGATSQTYSVPPGLSYSACYSVSVANSSGCIASSDTTCFMATLNGIAGINESEVFSIYPNPSGGNANITYSIPAGNRVSVRVINMVGQTIKTFAENEIQASGQHQYSLNSSDLAQGIYIIELSAGEKKWYRKLVVE